MGGGITGIKNSKGRPILVSITQYAMTALGGEQIFKIISTSKAKYILQLAESNLGHVILIYYHFGCNVHVNSWLQQQVEFA